MTQGHEEEAQTPRPAGPVIEGDSPAHPPEGSPSAPPTGGAQGARGSQAASDLGQQDAAGSGDQVERDFDALLAEAEQQRDEYLDLAKRSKADFENYRKRMAAEVQAAAVRGKSDLIREVVPVLDDLERALQAAGLDPEGDSEDGLAHGVLLVFRGLREAVLRNGAEVVDPTGEKFDPQWHEALSTVAVEGSPSGVVVETMQKGYRLGEQLVRPARVVVSE